MLKTSIIWFRQDLRIADNPAFKASIDGSKQVIAVYIHDEKSSDVRKHGAASKWFLHHSLKALEKQLEQKYKIKLIYREGKSLNILEEIISETNAEKVFWNRLYEPYFINRDTEIKESLTKDNIEVESFNGSLLVEPWQPKTGSGNYFKVYTPFYKKCIKEHPPRESLRAPEHSDKSYENNIKSDSLNSWKFLPKKPNWAKNFEEEWKISEADAHDMIYSFLAGSVENYSEERNNPALKGTSLLSSYLRFGIISPNQVYYAAEAYKEKEPQKASGIDKFISEIYWREFSYNLLYNFSEIADKNFRPEFDNFPWDKNDSALQAWQKGETGYPIVDAGMRQLWQTGWMHNRVRMVVASFLTKHLLIHWKQGEEWFWDTLIDADAANNTASWQWVAGCGADAAPYFRIFNPITQGEKFDPKGDYIRKYVPEIAKLPNKYLNKPWELSEKELEACEVKLGKTYPKPIVEHSNARERALKSYEKIKKST